MTLLLLPIFDAKKPDGTPRKLSDISRLHAWAGSTVYGWKRGYGGHTNGIVPAKAEDLDR